MDPCNSGLIKVQIKKTSYTLTIENYKYLSLKADEQLESPQFFIRDETSLGFFICYDPNSVSDNIIISLKIHSSVPYSEQKFHYTLSLLNEKQEKLIDTKQDSFLYSGTEETKSLIKFPIKDIKNTNDLFPNDLIIQCEIVMVLDCLTLTCGAEEQSQAVISKFEKLYLDELLSDVKLVASCGKSLPAHRCILVANSPVFEAMFTHDMLERKMEEVKIEDGDYEALEEMLLFIYAGKLVKTPSAELVKLADKYQVTGLIEYCQKQLCKTISVDNVLDILYIADRYNIKHLKEHAVDFTKAHLNSIVKSEGFKSSTHLDVLKDIIEAINSQ